MKKVLPFNIKFRDEIESGKCKVQTNDGRSVRIICWDGPDKLNPIYGLLEIIKIQLGGMKMEKMHYVI